MPVPFLSSRISPPPSPQQDSGGAVLGQIAAGPAESNQLSKDGRISSDASPNQEGNSDNMMFVFHEEARADVDIEFVIQLADLFFVEVKFEGRKACM